MKKSIIFTILMVLVLIPATLYFGSQLSGKGYYLTGTLLVIYVLIPFLLSFEGRKPQARELVITAVMCALAVASRTAFAFLPHFKPIFAIIIIAGIALGAEAGFLVGAISALVSNFFFGQGPWTPWQMMAYGICGCIAGLVYRKKSLDTSALNLAIFGFVLLLFPIGPLLDTCTVFTTLSVLTPQAVLAVYASGILTNIIQAAVTAVTLLILSKPLLQKLDRISKKYGLMNQ